MKLKLFLGALVLYAVSAAVVNGLIYKFDHDSVLVRRRVVELRWLASRQRSSSPTAA